MGHGLKRLRTCVRRMTPEEEADAYARERAEKLLSRQTASRVAQKELDRQADLMTQQQAEEVSEGVAK